MKTKFVVLIVFMINYTNSAISQVGLLDNSFGNNGIVITDIANGAAGRHIIEQPDGKILVEGISGDYLAIVRYNPDGTLDNSFNNGGRVTTTLNGSDYFTENDQNTFAIDSNMKITIAGAYENDIALMRYNTNGSLDNNFGLDGLVKTHIAGLQGSLQSIQVQTDGRITAIGGVADSIFGQGLSPSIIVARYSSNGSLDNSFGLNGLKIFDESDETGNSSAIQADGKIVIAGGGGNSGIILRLLPNGNLDSTFGYNGTVNKGGILSKVVIQSDYKILFLSLRDGNIFRLNTDGSTDNNFGSNGFIQSNLEYSNDIALQADGRILITGEDSGDFAISRLDSDGSLDFTFSSTGVINTDINHGSDDEAASITMQSDGKIIVAGETTNSNSSTYIAVARYFSGLNGINNIEKVKKATSFVFPNPVSDNATLYYNISFASEVFISLTDIYGKTLYNCAKGNESIGKYQEQIPLANIPSGFYFLNLKTISGSSTTKIIKE